MRQKAGPGRARWDRDGLEDGSSDIRVPSPSPTSFVLFAMPHDSTHASEPVLAEKPSAGTFEALKSRIKAHYDICSSYYLNLW